MAAASLSRVATLIGARCRRGDLRVTLTCLVPAGAGFDGLAAAVLAALQPGVAAVELQAGCAVAFPG